ncbi:Glucan 1,6-alpha-glucosidase [Metamycoplasma auris 15026]|uniref:Glucan 1,6-alpha-glucosidase n=1 Tax=Metamycoplasma auris 15026 TaxID=1188233 RepID=N9UZR1_9BACT|nr:glucan 1,6-alpha-glucosidase [Metamycoplasma auris]ENY68662.1 Glucan 1,6-alpha-glucosidase [Metamycoplasma auris 15026]
MFANKRIILYELKLENFYDADRSGFGNFKGMQAKLQYFKDLNVDIVAIDDILNQYQNNFNLEEIKNKYGSIKDFVDVVSLFQKNHIELAPILDLSNIKQSFINWNNMMNLYKLNNEINAEEKNLYLTKLDTYLLNKPFNQISLYDIFEFIKYFETILNFYLKLNVNAIILDNFEFLASAELKDEKKTGFINDLYKIIKRKNPNITVIFKSSNNNSFLYKKLISSKNKSFDYLYLTYLSVTQNKNKLKLNFKRKLNYNYVFKFIKTFSRYSNVIIALDSNKSGRFISKWGSEKSYFSESLKSILLFLYAGNNSIGLYYGDEIGLLRANFKDDFSFNDENFNEEKRFYQSKNIKLESFFLYHSYFNKLSSYTQMPWDSKLSLNYKNNENIFYAINHKENNIQSNLENKDSGLLFIYFLNKLIFDTKYEEFFMTNKFSIKHKRGFFMFKKSLKNEQLIFLINLSPRHKKIISPNDCLILSSSYINKFYSELPNQLSPFESLILLKSKN